MSSKQSRAEGMPLFRKSECKDCIDSTQSDFIILHILRELGDRIDASTSKLKTLHRDEASGNWIRDATIGQYRPHRPYAPRKNNARS